MVEFGGDDFADHVRDALCWAGMTECLVIAHTTAGQKDKNPHDRI